jgi:hypothetical protein
MLLEANYIFRGINVDKNKSLFHSKVNSTNNSLALGNMFFVPSKQTGSNYSCCLQRQIILLYAAKLSSIGKEVQYIFGNKKIFIYMEASVWR